jgi:hypothetical protein
MSKVRIEMNGPMRGKVWVDGVEQQNLTGLSLHVDVVEDVPCRVVLTQTIYCPELELDGVEVDVTTLTNNGAREYALGGRAWGG